MDNNQIPESGIRRVEILHIECPECGYKGITYLLAGDTYGILLGRNSIGQLAVLDTWKDTAFFDEISSVKNRLLSNLAEPELSDCFQKVVGLICDPSPSGEYYDFSGKDVCPNCKSSNANFFLDEPIMFDNIELANVSHREWDTLNNDEKATFMKEKLGEIGCQVDQLRSKIKKKTFWEWLIGK